MNLTGVIPLEILLRRALAKANEEGKVVFLAVTRCSKTDVKLNSTEHLV
jgi:hypothetical protein